MGSTASQIREELDQHRDDAAARLAELENRVGGAAEQAKSQVEEVRTQVEDAAQQVKQRLDITYQLQENPLVAVGAGLLVGFLLGGGLSGGGGGSRHSPAGYGSPSVGAHLQASLMRSAKSSGISDTLSAAGNALMSEVTKSVKGATGR